MTILDDVSMLRRIPLFAKIDSAKLKLLVFSSERLSYAENQTLFLQGDEANDAFVIVEGEADVVVSTPEGEIVVAHLTRNSIVGEIALLCDVPRTATVRATAPLKVLKISKEHFLRLLEEFPSTAISVMRELAQRLSRTTSELTQARSKLQELSRS